MSLVDFKPLVGVLSMLTLLSTIFNTLVGIVFNLLDGVFSIILALVDFILLVGVLPMLTYALLASSFDPLVGVLTLLTILLTVITPSGVFFQYFFWSFVHAGIIIDRTFSPL